MATIGVLLHVYHLEAHNWEQLMWGSEETDSFGTVTQFVHTLLRIPAGEQVKSVIFSGPSVKGRLSEGAYTKKFLLDRIHEFSNFPSLQSMIGALSSDDYDLFLRRVSELEAGPVITNTLDEVEHAAAYFGGDQAVDTVYQIAASTHAPRCLQAQLIARQKQLIPRQQPWYVVASDIGFSGEGGAEDVVILEPPHRGDDPMLGYEPGLAEAIRPYFGLSVEEKQRLIQTIVAAMAAGAGQKS